MENKSKKVVSKARREKAKEAPIELKNCPIGMFWLAKVSKIDSKVDDGGRCVRGSEGMLHLSEEK